MLCPDCFGKCYIFEEVVILPDDIDTHMETFQFQVPCPKCGGMGILHCCEGDRCND